MNCSEAIEYIHSLLVFGIQPGLERIEALCELLGNPQNSLNIVHVAGTNGKGSTSTMLAGIFSAAGYKTGLFTSPYVIDFRERIQVDGKMIPTDDLAAAVTEVKAAADELAKKGLQPTEFEAITAAAFLYFKKIGCERVVLEVGLGGRFDSTNIIGTPLASVITSISLDHTAVLGDTVEQIAFEKCGIIKQGGVTVSYPEQVSGAAEVIRSISEDRANTLIIPDSDAVKIISEDITGTGIEYKDIKTKVPFIGRHMVLNAITAVETALALGISAECIASGISSAKMPARMEILSEKPLIIMDGGHNEGCASALRDALDRFFNGKKILAVIGMMADKDIDGYLYKVAPVLSGVIATMPDNPRAETAEALSQKIRKYCSANIAVEKPEDAIDTALGLMKKYDALLISGSFYLAGDVRKYIIEKI